MSEVKSKKEKGKIKKSLLNFAFFFFVNIVCNAKFVKQKVHYQT
jgi:hypothetical protein